jgi:excisionase family DNA binding protein
MAIMDLTEAPGPASGEREVIGWGRPRRISRSSTHTSAACRWPGRPRCSALALTPWRGCWSATGVPRRPPGRVPREPPQTHGLKVREVAAVLKTSRATVYRLIRRGELDAVRLSERGLRVGEAALQAYLHEQQPAGLSQE